MTKDFVSKMALGFLMAQLFPGAIAVLGIALAWVALAQEAPMALFAIGKEVGTIFFTSGAGTTAFLFLSVASGMTIHGLAWAVRANVENRTSCSEAEKVSKIWYHKPPIVVQLAMAPLVMIGELVWLLGVKGIDRLKLEENVPRIRPDDMPKFQFLQDFYLHFGQFYVHTSYALLCGTLCLVVALQKGAEVPGRYWIIVPLYLLVGVLFLLGRVQLGTLFKAEGELLPDKTARRTSDSGDREDRAEH